VSGKCGKDINLSKTSPYSSIPFQISSHLKEKEHLVFVQNEYTVDKLYKSIRTVPFIHFLLIIYFSVTIVYIIRDGFCSGKLHSILYGLNGAYGCGCG
jgi:hypothetical protein